MRTTTKLFSVLALAASLTVGVGCSSPTIPTSGSTASGLQVERISASKGSRARFGVTKWHVIQQRVDGAVVVDGSDRTGKVRFSAAIRLDGDKVVVTSYAKKGSLVLDAKTGAIEKNTLGLVYARRAVGFLVDAERAGVAYRKAPKAPSPPKPPTPAPSPTWEWFKDTAKEAAKEAAKELARKAAEKAADYAEKAIEKYRKEPTPANEKAATDATERAKKAAEDLEKIKKDNAAPTAQNSSSLVDTQKELDAATKAEAEAVKQEELATNEEPKTDEDPTTTTPEGEQDTTKAEAQELEQEASGVEDAEKLGDEEPEPVEPEPGEAEVPSDEGETLPPEAEAENLDDGGSLEEEAPVDDGPAVDGEGDSTGDAQASGKCRKSRCSKSTRVCICAHY